MDWLHLLADDASPPTNEASSIGPYIFSIFSNVFFYLQQEFYHQNQR